MRYQVCCFYSASIGILNLTGNSQEYRFLQLNLNRVNLICLPDVNYDTEMVNVLCSSSLENAILIACIAIIIWLFVSYSRARRALQWWERRRAFQLYCETERIRNGLLQESLAMRRSIELLLGDSCEISLQSVRDWLTGIEKFHHSLGQLSDRLSPPYVEESLPLAIQYLLELWQTYNPKLNIQMELPRDWPDESPECSRVILIALDELLRITLSEVATSHLGNNTDTENRLRAFQQCETDKIGMLPSNVLTELSIHVSLKKQEKFGEIEVQISYPNESTLVSPSSLKDLDYLKEAFHFFTRGQCFYKRKDLTVVWYFRWRSPRHPLPKLTVDCEGFNYESKITKASQAENSRG